MQKHSAHYLTYALNATGQLLGIDDVPAGTKCGCFCPACKEPLIAKNRGLKRRHHFSHQSGTECNHALESMLHLLAKQKTREAFLTQTEFYVEFCYRSFCSTYRDCKFRNDTECCKIEKKRFNLKQYYDSCEQEIPYGNMNRRSDLKIFSSTKPERKPIYLEFFVTHASDSEKLHSGNKIIEIAIQTENDISRLVKDGIIEPTYDEFTDMEDDIPGITFHGFKNKDYKNERISIPIEFTRYILYKSGKIFPKSDSCNCKSLAKAKSSSLLEICVNTFPSLNTSLQIRYLCYSRFNIPNCILCKNYVSRYVGQGKICRLYKTFNMSFHEQIDTERARTCKSFKINQEEMESILEHGLNEDYVEFYEKQNTDDLSSLFDASHGLNE